VSVTQAASRAGRAIGNRLDKASGRAGLLGEWPGLSSTGDEPYERASITPADPTGRLASALECR
jgi:hypothetical protein